MNLATTKIGKTFRQIQSKSSLIIKKNFNGKMKIYKNAI
jgi:hypothetical protein